MAKWICPECESTDIDVRAWVKLNKLENKTIKTEEVETIENEEYWCCGCETHFKIPVEIE